jgi:hypothetical protein
MLRRDGWRPVHDHIWVNVIDRRCKNLLAYRLPFRDVSGRSHKET